MRAKLIYNKLNRIADKLGIQIIKGKGNFKGGSCVIKDKSVIVINNNKPFEDRIKNLALGLLEFNLNNIEISPKVNFFLDYYKNIKGKNEK